MKFTFYMAIR